MKFTAQVELSEQQQKYLNSFEKYLEKKGGSKVTVKNYLSDIRKFLVWKSGRAFESGDLGLYKKHLESIDTPENTINRALASIRKLFVSQGENLDDVSNSGSVQAHVVNALDSEEFVSASQFSRIELARFIVFTIGAVFLWAIYRSDLLDIRSKINQLFEQESKNGAEKVLGGEDVNSPLISSYVVLDGSVSTGFRIEDERSKSVFKYLDKYEKYGLLSLDLDSELKVREDAKFYKDVDIENDLDVSGDIEGQGGLSILGGALFADNVRIEGELRSNGDARFTSDLTALGNVIIGDSSFDNITINASLSSNLIPSEVSTYNLGSALLPFANVYADNLVATATDISGTKQETLTIDSDNTEGDLALIFGQIQDERLIWDNSNSRFRFTDALHVDDNFTVGGNVGIGTTAPLASLHVVGQCVTGDTLLKRRRRRKGKNGEWIEEWEEIRIDEIKPGDEILTLDENTGEFVVSKVKALMDMGTKAITKITTQSGKTIRTTSNHPYFVKTSKDKKPKVGVFYDNANMYFAAKDNGWKVDSNELYKLLNKSFDLQFFNYYIAIPDASDHNLKGTQEFLKNLSRTITVKQKPLKYIPVEGGRTQKKGDIDMDLAMDVVRSIDDLDLVVVVSGDSDYLALADWVEKDKGKQIAFVGYRRNTAWELWEKQHLFAEKIRNIVDLKAKKNPKFHLGVTLLSYLYQNIADVSSGKWVKVKDIKTGSKIAVAGKFNKAVFEKIVKIEHLPAEQVYDIEVEGTHNFVGNGIVAHNTYIKGADQLNTSFSLRTADSAGADKFVVTNTGNVGIGTTSPMSKLHIEGQCVALGTKIKRRRKKNGKYTEDEIPVEDVQAGDEVLSLNDQTGNFEWHKVEKTLDKDIQEAFEIQTSTGKRIKTTNNHPYLNIAKPEITYGTFEVDQSIKIEDLGKPTIIGVSYGNLTFTAKITQADKKEIKRSYQRVNKTATFTHETFAVAVVQTLKAANIYPSRLIVDIEYSGYERRISNIIKTFFPDTEVISKGIGRHSPAHLAALETTQSKRICETRLIVNKEALGRITKGRGSLETLRAVTCGVVTANRSPHGQLGSSYYKDKELSRAKWIKTSQIKVGSYIATETGFEKVVSLRKVGRLHMYDLQIEDTHNFVGNGIVAHNTYISGNVGIGTTAPASALEIGGSGNVRIGGLSASSGVYTDSSKQLTSTAPSSGILGFWILSGITLWPTTNTNNITTMGNVGVGTTSPLANLHVVGQCVTGDTLLKRRRRRRRKGKNGEWIEEDYWEDVRIDQIQERDEILTLDEETGQFVISKVNGLMDMGVQQTYLLITETGKQIRTTGNHPYLTAKSFPMHKLNAKVLEVDQSNRIEDFTKDSFVAVAWKDISIILKISKQVKRQLFEEYKSKRHPNERQLKMFAPTVFGNAIAMILASKQIVPAGLIIDIEYSGHENAIIQPIKSYGKSIDIHFASIGKNSPAHYATYGAFIGRQKTDIEANKKDRDFFLGNYSVVTPQDKSLTIRNTHDQFMDTLYQHKLPMSTDTSWKRVYELKVGVRIATVDGWEKVIAIKEFAKEQTYDIEVANTHNFVGNGIVAHNTYLQGAGTTTGFSLRTVDNNGADKFAVLDNGNVGIGTTAPNSKLEVNGVGSFSLGAVGAPGISFNGDLDTGMWSSGANALNLSTGGSERMRIDSSGNVGIGTTGPGAKLHVLGECIVKGSLVRRRKKKGGDKDDEDNWEDVPVEDIQPGDEILSLNETTGKFEWQKVEETMDKGVQTVYELKTETGKAIETTANHPYLVKQQTNTTPLFAFVDEVGIFDSGTYSQMGVGTLILKKNEIELNQKLRNILLETVSKLNQNEITFEFKFKYITPNSLPFYHKLLDKMEEYVEDWEFLSILEKREEGRFWTQYLSLVERLVTPLSGKFIVLADHLNKPVKATQSLSDFNGTGSIVKALQLESQGTMLLQIADVLLGAVTYQGSDVYKQEIADRAKEIVAAQQKRAGVDPIYAAPRPILAENTSLSSGKWTKVSEISKGRLIATVDGFEKIVSIKKTGRKQTYDLQIANTHNFVAQKIVAHNTYLQGAGTTTGFSLRTADSAGANKFVVLDNGNVGIGTTGPGTNLEVVGGGSSTEAQLFLTSYHATVPVPGLVGRGARGTVASPTAVQADDSLMFFGGRGYGSTGFSSGSRGAIIIKSSQIWTDANQGTYLTLSTTPNNSTTLAERVRIDNAGNVGIGTTSPNSKLEVNGVGSFSLGAVGAPGISFNGDLDTGMWSSGANALNLSTGGSERLRIDSSGNVGIGTTGPTNQLHLYSGSGWSTLGLQAPNGRAVISLAGAAATADFGVGQPGENELYIRTSTADPINFMTSNTYRLALGATGGLSLGSSYYNTDPGSGNMIIQGNVGIGDVSPAYLLTVGSGDLFGVNSSGYALLPAGAVGTPSLTFTGDTNTGLYNTAADKLGLVAGGTESMTITSGNVGIGTTSPIDTLQVKTSGQGSITFGGSTGRYIRAYDSNGDPSTLEVPNGNFWVGTGALYSDNATGSRGRLGLVGQGSTFSYDGDTLESYGASVYADSVMGNPGLALAGYNFINFFTNNQSKMVIDNAGNVGIGTTGPNSKLEVNGVGSFSLGAVGAPGISFNGDLDTGMWSSGANALNLSTGGSERLRIDNNGNVGIGTTGPATKLHLSGDGTSGANAITFRWAANSTGYDPHIDFYKARGTIASPTIIQSGDGAGMIIFGGYDGVNWLNSAYIGSKIAATPGVDDMPGYLYFSTTADGTYSPTERMRLSAAGGLSLGNSYVGTDAGAGNMIISGNVGIGTVSPGAKLQIQGAGTTTGLSLLTTDSAGTQRFAVLDNGNVGIGTTNPVTPLHVVRSSAGAVITALLLENPNSTIGTGANINLGAYDTGGNQQSIGQVRAVIEQAGDASNIDSYLSLWSKLNGTLTERMRIDSSGNVGIGTTGPGAKLDISSPNTTTAFTIRNSSNSNRVLMLLSNSADNGIFTLNDSSETAKISLLTSGVSYLNGGNVGIGTTNPSAKLEVAGDVKFLGSNPTTLTFGSTAANAVINSPASFFINLDSTSAYSDALVFSIAKDRSGVSGGTELFRVQENGNVGIGTTSPLARLGIVGADALNTSFAANISGSTGTGLVVTNAGNVGIGTTSPGAKLEVRNLSTNDQIRYMWATDQSLAFGGDGTIGPYLVSHTDQSGLSIGNYASIRQLFGANGFIVQTSPATTVGNTRTFTTQMTVNTSATTLAGNLIVSGTGNSSIAGNVGIGTTAPNSKLEVNGVGSFSLGAVGAPGISFNGDLDTGMWSSGANALNLSTGGSERMRIDSSGNVGIGTVSPGQKLSVKGAGLFGSTDAWVQSPVSAGTDLAIQGNVGIGTTGPGSLLDVNGTVQLRGSSGTVGLYVDSSGQVGIGKTPTTALDVSGSIYASGLIYAPTIQAGASASLFYGSSKTLGIASDAQIAWSQNDNASLTKDSGLSRLAAGKIGIGNGTIGDYSGTLIAGNVGIGDASPAYLLTVGSGDLFGVNSSGYALLPAGAVGTPSLTFTGDTNTGLYNTAADKLGLVAGGTESMTITNGNIGIGTTGPSYRLDITSGTVDSVSRFLSSDDLAQILISDDDTTGYVGAKDSKVFLGLTSGLSSSNLVIDNNGNVGIGTTGPGSRLSLGTSQITDATDASLFRIYEGGANNNYGIGWNANSGEFNFNAGSGGFLAFRTANTERVRILNNGNVGIGEVSPGAKLSVSGGLAVGSGYDTTAVTDGNMIIQGNVGIGTTSPNSKLEVNGVGSFSLGAVGAPGISFNGDLDTGMWSSGANALNLSTGGSERLRIDNAGNVGIGTTEPGVKLDVAGAIRTNSNFYMNGGISNITNGNDVINVNKNLGANVTASWSTGTAGGTVRDYPTGTLYNGKIYMWGGYNGSYLNTLDIYDIASNSWSTGTAGGTGRTGHTATLYNGKIYMWGGYIGSYETLLNTVDIYDIASNSWSTGTAGGTARYIHTGTLYNGKIYMWGGYNLSGNLNTVDIYDIASNSWSTGTAGGTARRYPVGTLYNGKIYMWSGYNGGYSTTVDIYDITNNSWSTGTAGGTARVRPTATLYNGKIYMWGGNNPSHLNTVDIYDIASSSWFTGTAGGTGRTGHIASIYNGKIYMWGGYNAGGNLNTVDIYDIGNRQSILSLQENGIDTFSFQTQSQLFLSNGRMGIIGGNVGIGTTSPNSKLEVNGVGSFSLGAVGAPGISFNGDLDTGMWSSGANALNLSTGGSERLRIDNAGNVGIGTTGPSDKLSIGSAANPGDLSVYSGTAASDNLSSHYGYLFRNASTFVNFASLDSSNNVHLGTSANANLQLYTNNLRRVTIDNSGNVGIGTTSPNSKLEVNGVGSFSLGAVGAPGISFNGDLDTGMWSSGANALNLSTGGSERLRIDSSGNVGIGTTSPGAKLHSNIGSGAADAMAGYFYGSTSLGNTFTDIAGRTRTMATLVAGNNWGDANGNVLNVYSAIGDGLLFVKASGNVGIGTTSPNSKLEVNGVGSFSLGAVGAPGISFNGDLDTGMWSSGANALNLSTGGSERMRIDSSGNVGIGTTGPSAKLEVNGQVKIDDLTAAGGADAVLSSGGILTTVSSSQRYKTNISDYSNKDILGIVNKLRPVSFDWKDNTLTPGMHDFGLIAEEVYQIAPELVTYEKDGTTIRGVKYDRLPILLTKAVQELSAVTDSQQIEITAIGTQNKTAEEKLLTLEQTLSSIKLDENGNIITTETDINTQLTTVQDTILNLEQRIAILENAQTTQDAQDTQPTDTSQNQSNTLEPALPSGPQQQLNELTSGYELLTTKINLLEQIYQNSATDNPETPAQPENQLFTQENELNIHLDKNLTIFKNLNVLGSVTLVDLATTGNITAGLIEINSTEQSINAIGTKLQLQNQPGADNIEIFAGKIVLTKEGNIQLNGQITANKLNITTQNPSDENTDTSQQADSEGIVSAASAGKTKISKGQTTTTIETIALTPNSLIFVTPEKPIPIGAQKNTQTENSFTITLSEPQEKDLEVNWWVIN